MMRAVLALAVAFAFGVSVRAADEAKLTCPKSGQPASKDHTAKINGGEVAFCCDNCAAAVKADSKKYAAKVNYQLAQTKQIKQKGCPFTGGEVNKDTIIKIGDVEVGFCCANCQGKVKDKAKDKQIDLVFKDTKKGFEKAEKAEK